MGKKNKKLNDTSLFINRESSWLEFNDRVLREGLNEQVPLLERLKFLAIVSSNLDEFFMVRVAGLRQQHLAGVRKHDFSGMTPARQLGAIAHRVHEMVRDQSRGIRAVLGRLAEHGLCVTEPADWRTEQKRFMKRFWADELKAVLTPVAVQSLHPCPLLPGLQLNIAVLASAPNHDADKAELVVVPVPGRFNRFVTLPATERVELARLEDIIIANIGDLLSGRKVLATAVFRITRDADVELADDAANDLLATMEKAVLDRRRRQVVRLAVSAGAEVLLHRRLVEWLELAPEEVYEIDGLLDAGALWEIATRSGFDNLKYSDWPPQPPRDLLDADDVFQAIQNHDVLLFHPYESFDSVVELMQRAAEDPDVLAIKQTLYRTSGDSPIIKALARAAENGKEVTVLVELKARFDEARNVGWARRLEDAGCLVIYGVA
ncbi:MAG: polyphosphate kinase, partial [Sedimentisphaerales bacterium]|nr:polyphosphate kinase [Sedimentisphaerales bacterium]